MARLPLLAALTAIGLAACAAPPAGMAPEPGVTVTSRLVVGASYGLRSVTTVSPYAASEVATLKVYLRRGDEAERLVGTRRLDAGAVKLANLRKQTAYRVRLEAFTAAGLRIDANADDAAGDADPEGCERAFTTTTALDLDLSAPATAFRVKLLDKAYAGQASGGVTVAEGAVVAEPAGVTASVATPTPTPAGAPPLIMGNYSAGSQTGLVYRETTGTPAIRYYDTANELIFFYRYDTNRAFTWSPSALALLTGSPRLVTITIIDERSFRIVDAGGTDAVFTLN